MASETTEKCPRCGGQAEGFAVMCGPRKPGSDDMKCTTGVMACDFCGGLGIVESTVAERYRRRRAIMEQRKKYGLTVRQQAEILRMNPVLLNDIEWGRADWRSG